MKQGWARITRRTLLQLSRAAVLCSVASEEGRAEDYPSRSITLLVPFTPGGSVDLIARLTAAKMADSLGQPVVVLNLPGASGAIATMRVVNAAPDGYTLEICTPREISTAALVNPNVTYDVERDFTYVALGGRSPIVVAGGPTLQGYQNVFRSFDRSAQAAPRLDLLHVRRRLTTTLSRRTHQTTLRHQSNSRAILWWHGRVTRGSRR